MKGCWDLLPRTLRKWRRAFVLHCHGNADAMVLEREKGGGKRERGRDGQWGRKGNGMREDRRR